MDKWSAKGFLWKGEKSRFAHYSHVIALIKSEPLIVTVEENEVAVANIFGLHLGYLTRQAAAKAIVKHNEGYMLLAKVDQPMVKIEGKLCRLGIYVWAEQDRLDSDNKELVDVDAEFDSFVKYPLETV